MDPSASASMFDLYSFVQSTLCLIINGVGQKTLILKHSCKYAVMLSVQLSTCNKIILLSFIHSNNDYSIIICVCARVSTCVFVFVNICLVLFRCGPILIGTILVGQNVLHLSPRLSDVSFTRAGTGDI